MWVEDVYLLVVVGGVEVDDLGYVFCEFVGICFVYFVN